VRPYGDPTLLGSFAASTRYDPGCALLPCEVALLVFVGFSTADKPSLGRAPRISRQWLCRRRAKNIPSLDHLRQQTAGLSHVPNYLCLARLYRNLSRTLPRVYGLTPSSLHASAPSRSAIFF